MTKQAKPRRPGAVGPRLDGGVMALPPERAAFDAWMRTSDAALWMNNSASLGGTAWAAWRGAREDGAAQLERTAQHMRENAEALRKYPGMEQEARARELAACNVDSLARLWRMERQLDDMLERHNAEVSG